MKKKQKKIRWHNEDFENRMKIEVEKGFPSELNLAILSEYNPGNKLPINKIKKLLAYSLNGKELRIEKYKYKILGSTKDRVQYGVRIPYKRPFRFFVYYNFCYKLHYH